MTMPAKTLKALQGSIEKWEKVAAGTEEDKGKFDCPLCHEFLNKNCEGCPVAENAKDTNCKGTPYEEWDEHHLIKHGFLHRVVPDCPECFRLAKAELDFLKSLLPKGAKNDKQK